MLGPILALGIPCVLGVDSFIYLSRMVRRGPTHPAARRASDCRLPGREDAHAVVHAVHAIEQWQLRRQQLGAY